MRSRRAAPSLRLKGRGRLAPFTERVIIVIRAVPRGRVATYGQVAALAGGPTGARQVARILHSLSSPKGLPWHRIINACGGISLPKGAGLEEQRRRLRSEGVTVSAAGNVNLSRWRWEPRFGEIVWD